MNLGDLNEEISDFNALYEAGEIDEATRDSMIEKATNAYAQQSSTTTTTQEVEKPQKKDKPKRDKKPAVSKVKQGDNCDDLRQENKQLKTQLSENTKVIKPQDRSNDEPKRKASATKKRSGIKSSGIRRKRTSKANPDAPKKSATKRNTNKAPKSDAPAKTTRKRTGKAKTQSQTSNANTNAEKPLTKAQQAKAMKDSAKKNKVTQVQGKAVMQYSIIRTIANKFFAKKDKEIDETWARNFLSFVQKANKEGKFNKNTPQWGVANKAYQDVFDVYKKDFGGFTGKKPKVGSKFTEKDWKMIEEVAKGEYLPLTIQHLKAFIGVVKNPTNEKVKALLKRMKDAKDNGSIKTTDLSYDKWKQAYAKLEKNDLSFDKTLQGIQGLVSGLSGFAQSLSGLGSLEGIRKKRTMPKKKSRRLGNIEEETEEREQDNEIPEKMTTSEMLNRELEVYEFSGRWKKLMRNPSKGFTAMIYGLPGQGKTSLSVQLANYLAQFFGDVLYVSPEEHASQSQKDTVILNGVDSDYITWTDSLEKEDLNDYDFVFIDSVTAYKLTLDDFRELKDDYPNTAFVLIFQATKEGNFKGEQDWEHEVDTVIQVKDFTAESRKRFGTNELMGIR